MSLRSISPDRLVAFLLLLLTVLLYANSIGNLYNIDDDISIFKNPYIAQGISGIPDIITHPYIDTYYQSSYGYRPIAAISFAIEHQLWGFNPHLSHLINILLYALNAIVLLWWLRRLCPTIHPYWVYAVALLFVAHPIHTEVVNSLKSRDILGAFLLGMAALTVATPLLRQPASVGRILLSLLLYSLACLSHPMAFIFTGVWGAMLLLTQPLRAIWANRQWSVLGLLLGFAVVFKLIDTYTSYISSNYKTDANFLWENPLYVLHNTANTVGLAFNVLLFYAQKLLLPYPLCYYYGYNQIAYESWQNPLPLFSIVLHVLMLVVGVAYLLRQHLLGFILLAYLICIFPFSNLLQIGPGIVAERWAYFASAGAVMLFAYIIFKLCRVPLHTNTDTQPQVSLLNAPIALVAVILLAYSTLVWLRNPNWYDATTLAAHDLPYLSNSAKAHSFLGEELMKNYLTQPEPNAQQHQAIENLFLRSLQIDSTYAEVWNNLGVMNFRKSDTTTAQICYEQALKYKQPYYLAMSNLADIYNKKGDFVQAEKLYEQHVAQDSTEINAFLNLARFQSANQHLELALQTNQKALRLFPQQKTIIYDNMAAILYENDQKQQALSYWQLALQHEPQNEGLQYKAQQVQQELAK